MDQCEICKKPLKITEGVSAGGMMFSRRIIVCEIGSPCFDAAHKLLVKTEGVKLIGHAKKFMELMRKRARDKKLYDDF